MSNKKKAAREELAALYRQVYERCMEGETKAFDAKGALSALEQIGKMKGVDEAQEQNAKKNVVTLTLSDEVDGRGD